MGVERRGYDPGIVVGTSMGAIVGALYAAGYPADRVWRIMKAEDWPELFVPTPLPVGPERERRYPLVRLGPGADPPEAIWGLVPDWRINRRLVQLLFDPGARARGDFDRLPRRFRAVAADLETGQAVVLGGGDLARAVRASIAVPGVFAPVEWEDRVLVDGGIASYLPIPEARALGAERVIAVDVIRPPPTLEEGGVNDPLDAGTRAFRLLLLNTLPEDARPDELVLPDIPPSISSAAFPRDATRLLRAGLEGALRDLPPADGGPPAPRRAPPPPDALGALVVETPDPALEALVRAELDDVAPGPYRPAAVLDAVDDLYGTGFFQGVWPRVVPADRAGRDEPGDDAAAPPRPRASDDAPALAVWVDPVPATTIAAAAGYEHDRGFRAWGTVAQRVGVGGPAELAFDASFDGIDAWASASVRVASLRAAPLVWTAGGHYREVDARAVIDGEIFSEFDVDRVGGWLGAEFTHLGPDWTATALLLAENVEPVSDPSGLSVGPLVRLADPSPFIRIVGLPVRLEAEWRFGDVDYGRAHLRGSAGAVLGRLRLAVLGDAVVTGGGAPVDVLPALGDEHLVPGFRWGEARGRARVVGGIDAAHPAPFGSFLRLRLRAGAAPGDLDPDLLTDRDAWVAGAGIDLLWPTPFGWIEFGVGANTRDRWRLEIDVGPRF